MTFIRKLLALPRRFRARRRSARLRSVLRQIAGMDDRKATGLISDARRKHLDRLPLTVLRLEHERAVGGRGDSGVDSEALWRFTASAGDFDWGEWAGRWANAFLARVGDASAPRGAAADPLKHLAALRRLSCDPVPEALRAVPEIARSRRADLTAGRAYLEYLLTAGREDEPVVAHALHAVCERPGPAAEELTRACKELLEWPESARNLGRRALGREEFGVARSEFIEAARLAGPGDSHLAAAAMGRIHLGLREWKAAIESFETALAASEVPDAEILLTVARLEELEATLGRTRIPRAEAERLLEALGERIRNSPPSLTAPGLTASSRLRHLRRMSGPRRACRDFVHGGGAACEASALRGWAVGLLTDLGAFGRSGPPEDQRTPARGRWLLRHGRFGDFESEYGGRLGSRVTSLPPSLRLLRADRLVRLGRGDDVLASLRLERGTPEEQAYNLEIRLRAMLLGGRNEDAAALHSGPEGVLLQI